MDNTRTSAQWYALVVGTVLLVTGIVGFFYSAAFGTPGKVNAVYGILDVNGWHNVVHLATGGLGLLSLGYAAARTYALGLGVVYLVVAIWGFVAGDGASLLGFLPINTADNVLHLALGILGLAAGAASGEPARTAPAAGT